MTAFIPKFITFDCYGTLTHFDMPGASRRIYGEMLSSEENGSLHPQLRGLSDG